MGVGVEGVGVDVEIEGSMTVVCGVRMIGLVGRGVGVSGSSVVGVQMVG